MASDKNMYICAQGKKQRINNPNNRDNNEVQKNLIEAKR